MLRAVLVTIGFLSAAVAAAPSPFPEVSFPSGRDVYDFGFGVVKCGVSFSGRPYFAFKSLSREFNNEAILIAEKDSAAKMKFEPKTLEECQEGLLEMRRLNANRGYVDVEKAMFEGKRIALFKFRSQNTLPPRAEPALQTVPVSFKN